MPKGQFAFLLLGSSATAYGMARLFHSSLLGFLAFVAFWAGAYTNQTRRSK